MKRMMVVMMGLAMALGTLTWAFAEDVFVTKNGKAYHHAGSPFIKNRETVRMTREEAEAKGYKPSKSYLKAVADEKAQGAVKGQTAAVKQ